MNSTLMTFLLVFAAMQGPELLEIPQDTPPPRVVPEGSVIAVSLITPISSEHAQPGDGVYARTIFPITADNKVVIPVGTYVQGRVVDAVRAGRLSGKSEMTINFHTLVFESGTTVPIYGSLGGIGGVAERTGEAGITGNSTRGADVTVVGSRSATGATVGAIASRSTRGVLLGAGIGAGIGLAEVLLTRGDDVILQPGTLIEIVLDSPLEL